MVTTLDSNSVLLFLINGLIASLFSILTGVTTYFVRRAIETRLERGDAKESVRPKSPSKKFNFFGRLQKAMMPIIPLLPIIGIVIFVGSYWLFAAYLTTLGIIVGFRWNNQ